MNCNRPKAGQLKKVGTDTILFMIFTYLLFSFKYIISNIYKPQTATEKGRENILHMWHSRP